MILSLPACGALDTVPMPGELGTKSSLANTRWGLVSYGQPGSETLVMEGSGITLKFEEGNQVGGSAGCNTFGAQYDVAGDTQLSITDITSTLMACANQDLMEQERHYLDALQSAQSFEYNGESLTIRHRDGVLNFSRLTSRIPRIVHT